ncbi:nucleoside deaminase [Blastococcus sp. Marseille-P5729]|uniref:nucleoside deaminase n=1 Tax=Blastococcus sp. Marseille-P5729 TaxID=2086582 RepID=UPI001F3AA7FD|nr:nucleoside deaminase [Blastococcus sp. Marseille-P5729]
MSTPYDAAMRVALGEARAATQHGDIPIGAVVTTPDGRIVGRGGNARERDHDPTAHAEILALRAAARRAGEWRLDGHTLVVTIEPCTMCAGAAVLARVERIVFGALEPKTGAVVSLWDVVRDPRLNHRPEVLGPWDLPESLGAECAGVMREFFDLRRD